MMGTMEIASAQLSECSLAETTSAYIERNSLPTIYYGLAGSGIVLIEGEAAIELVPHTLLVAPANKTIDIITAGSSSGGRGPADRIAADSFVPGSMPRYAVGKGDTAFCFVCGCFHA